MTPHPRIHNLDRRRAALGIDHGALCEEAGIDRTSWYRYRTGRRAITLDRIDWLERALSRLIARRARTLAVLETTVAGPERPEEEHDLRAAG